MENNSIQSQHWNQRHKMLVKFRLNALTAAEVRAAAQELYQEDEAKLQRDLGHLATWAQQSPHLASIRRDEVGLQGTWGNITIHDII